MSERFDCIVAGFAAIDPQILLPIVLAEVSLALWLLVKGVAVDSG